MQKRKPTLKSLKNKAWQLCSRYVRLREADKGGYVHCYTCKSPIHAINEAQAGHSIPGRHNAVLLDDSICRPQCYRCNCAMGGRLELFATNLIKEMGMDWWEGKLAASRQAVKFTREDLEEKIATFKAKLNGLGTHPQSH